jgi:hypothetical protein
MEITEILAAKRRHLARLASEGGAAGESSAIAAATDWIPRPKGKALKALLAALAETDIRIKPSSFDAIATSVPVDFESEESLRNALGGMVFIEIKSASQSRVKAEFGGFFFALTESEIVAADQLRTRHRVALFNRLSGEVLLTSIPEILARARSTTWQLSIQL